MRYVALLLLVGAALARPPKAPEAVPNSKTALEMARTRGKLIFLTVIVDHDHENRAVIEEVFRDRGFLKIADEFVIVYANPETEHGRVQVRGKDGKKVARCADCPSIRCEDHVALAQHWSRGFFPDSIAKTPIHFVVDEKEELVATIMNGDFETGFNHVSASQVIGELRKLLKTHGRGLTEAEYEKLVEDASDARAARARGNVTLELEKLVEIVAAPKEVQAVREAKERIQQIDKVAAKEYAPVEAMLEKQAWEEALDALAALAKKYPGTLTAGKAEDLARDLNGRDEVQRLLKARDYYEQGLNFKKRGKLELARKRFEKCVRLGEGTKYAALAQQELDAMR